MLHKSKRSNRYFWWLMILLLLVGTTQFSIASNFRQVEILKQSGADKSPREMLMASDIGFKTYSGSEPVNNENKEFWLRFIYYKRDLQNASYLYYPFMVFKKLDLYFLINDSLHHYESGLTLKFSQRNFYAPNLYLELPNVDKPVKCLLKISGFHSYLFFFSEVNSKEAFKIEVRNAISEFFFIGIGCLTILFSLIFFFYLKDKLYLHYSLFSFFLIASRLTFSGYIFNYIYDLYHITDLESLNNIYSICYGGVNIALILYFQEFLKYYHRSKKYTYTIYGIVTIRFIFLMLHVFFNNEMLDKVIDSHLIDLAIQLFFLVIAGQTAKHYLKPTLLVIVSLVILIMGNLLLILPELGLYKFNTDSYYLFLNVEAVEVVIFAISMGYRHRFLKTERDTALLQMVENLKESERLKDNLNKELEIKVAERTLEIQEMNELLKKHNIQLKSEVVNSNEARVFHKNMNFEEFQKIFPDDQSCYDYLAKLKWNSMGEIKCKKCGYEHYTLLANHTIRCGKCGFIESVTNGTLFHHIKFSLQKAFYITYLTSLGTKESSVVKISKELEMRSATVWNFKKKVMTLIEAYKTKKKHKDGWSHLILMNVAVTRSK